MQQELLNCLSEAMPYAVARRGDVRSSGSGDFIVRRSEPVYCKSTDGFAGMMLVSVDRYSSAVAARLAFESIGDPGDDYVELLSPAWFVPEGGLLCCFPEDPDLYSGENDCPF